MVRVEQLYPMPLVQLEKIFNKYPNAKVKWVQEEPANMGGWQYILSWYSGDINIEVVARKTSASPATGFKKVHEIDDTMLENYEEWSNALINL